MKRIHMIFLLIAGFGFIWNSVPEKSKQNSPSGLGMTYRQCREIKAQVGEYWKLRRQTASLDYSLVQFDYDQRGADSIITVSGFQGLVVRSHDRELLAKRARDNYRLQLTEGKPMAQVFVQNWGNSNLVQNTMAITKWIQHQYLYGFWCAILLFIVWFERNQYFRRFARNPFRALIAIVLWPITLFMLLRQKFSNHYYSLVAETVVRAMRKRLSGILTIREQLLMAELIKKRTGVVNAIRMFRVIQPRHGFLISFVFVAHMRISACVAKQTLWIGVSDPVTWVITHAPPDIGAVFDLQEIRPSIVIQKIAKKVQKIFFHFLNWVSSGHVRRDEPIPLFGEMISAPKSC